MGEEVGATFPSSWGCIVPWGNDTVDRNVGGFSPALSIYIYV